MCGIVGVIDSQDCQEIVFDGLKKLQYRGYDSAGICLKNEKGLHTYKTKGTIDSLIKKSPEIKDAYVAIGHTRWATHGEVSEKNAHPITSLNGEWAIVHNGIIENFEELKDNLVKEGLVFKTETDSEVIASLLSLKNFKNDVENLIWATKKLKGSYAFCALKNDKEKSIFVAKNKSPLYIYCKDNTSIVASDPICFPEGEYYKMEDLEFAQVSQSEVIFYNIKGEKIIKQPITNVAVMQDVLKNGYEHFMLKEIYETPEALQNLYTNLKDYDFSKIKKWWINKVKLIGCGTAFHSCLMGARFFKKFLKVDAEAITASEFRYDYEILDSTTLCIFVSQSGETADTIAAAEKAKKFTKKIIALTNVAYSTLASISSITLPISAGPEIAVASTKAYCCQVAALYLLANAFTEKRFDKALKKIKRLSNILERFYVNLGKFAFDIVDENSIFFIGRGADYVTALEGALKLKEISYINCNAFAAGELKHGVLTLIEKETPVIVIATDKKIIEKTMNSAFEAKARGAKLYLITALPPHLVNLDKFEMCLSLPNVDKDLICVLATIPLQLLAYNVAVMKGNNPDMPRNLAKSVTVE